MLIEVPPNTRGKHIKVDTKMLTLKVQILDDVLIDGLLYEKCQVDECLWTLETDKGKKILDILIVKWPKIMHWWDCVI